MKNYTMKIVFAKSKPLIVLSLKNGVELKISSSWKQKCKKKEDNTYHIYTTIIEDVFTKNSDILGEWKNAKFDEIEIEKYYGFKKISGLEIHSLELTKRFISDWIEEYTKLNRYTINNDDNDMDPIIKECLYDAGIYSDGEVGNVTYEEVDCLRRVINPDGEIITKMKQKLKNQ